MSTSTSNMSWFQQAVESRQATAVAMNGLGFIAFSQTSCIDTDQLESCSVIIIIFLYTALLRHVFPCSDNSDPDDTNAEDNHVRSFMKRFIDYYRRCRSWFPDPSSSWIICAVFEGAIALFDQQKIMKRALGDVRLKVDKSYTYQVPFKDDDRDRGSVFIDVRGGTVKVYVKDRLVENLPREQSVTTATASTAYGTTPFTATALTAYGTTPSTATALIAYGITPFMATALIAYTTTPFTATALIFYGPTPFMTTTHASVGSASYTHTLSASYIHTPSTSFTAFTSAASSNLATEPQWQWNVSQQQYQYVTQGEVQHSQTAFPLNIWVYCPSSSDEAWRWALWDDRAWRYR